MWVYTVIPKPDLHVCVAWFQNDNMIRGLKLKCPRGPRGPYKVSAGKIFVKHENKLVILGIKIILNIIDGHLLAGRMWLRNACLEPLI